jgi:hypothetical protein
MHPATSTSVAFLIRLDQAEVDVWAWPINLPHAPETYRVPSKLRTYAYLTSIQSL